MFLPYRASTEPVKARQHTYFKKTFSNRSRSAATAFYKICSKTYAAELTELPGQQCRDIHFQFNSALFI